MKISVIIPVYNSEKYLKRLIDSILEQTYSDYEIVIINDGSTDNSLDIIKKYNNIKIKCKTISNSGPGIARKIGLENSIGNLIFFVDSDDYLPNKNVLSDINMLFEKTKFDILFFDFIRMCNNKEQITNIFLNTQIKERLYSEDFLFYNRVEGALWGKVFNRNIIKNNYFCNFNNYEDYYTTYKTLNECKKIYYTKKVLYYANRDNDNSTSKYYDFKKIEDTIKLLIEINDFSKYKDVISTMICQYYCFAKKKINSMNLSKNEICYINNKINILKKYIKFKSLFKVRKSYKILIKYVLIKLKIY